MRLYVWFDFCFDYTPGLAVVVAKNKRQAKRLLNEDFSPNKENKVADRHDDPISFDLKTPKVFHVSGGGR